jgi:hypothetical protein
MVDVGVVGRLVLWVREFGPSYGSINFACRDEPLAGHAIASPRMMLAGIPVPDQVVLDLTRSLRDAGFDETAKTLEDAYDAERAVVALTIPDREAILRTLDDPPEDLADLAAYSSASMNGEYARGSSSASSDACFICSVVALRSPHEADTSSANPQPA